MLNDKVAIVTGAGSGIGRAVAEKLGRAGALVILSDVDEEGGEESVRRLTSSGGEAAFVRADVSRAADNEALVAEAIKRSVRCTSRSTTRESAARPRRSGSIRSTAGTTSSH